MEQEKSTEKVHNSISEAEPEKSIEKIGSSILEAKPEKSTEKLIDSISGAELEKSVEKIRSSISGAEPKKSVEKIRSSTSEAKTEKSIDKIHSSISEAKPEQSVENIRSSISGAEPEKFVEKIRSSISGAEPEKSVEKIRSSISGTEPEKSVEKIRSSISQAEPEKSVKKIRSSIPGAEPEKSVEKIRSSVSGAEPEKSVKKIRSSIPGAEPEKSVEKIRSSISEAKTEKSIDKIHSSISGAEPEKSVEKIRSSVSEAKTEKSLEKIRSSIPGAEPKKSTEKIRNAISEAEPEKSTEKIHSLPNLRQDLSSVAEFRKFSSLSLSQIRRHSEFGEHHYKPAPFNLRWIYGYNPKVGVINLNNKGTTTAFYAASNCGVLYDWSANQMRILQGHRHMVTCIAKDAEGKWLVTADSGPENTLIIWDSFDYFPVKTLYAPHGSVKLSKLAMSGDAKYLLTLGYHDKASLRWWIWAYGQDEPHATIDIDIPRGGVIGMDFNPYNSKQFLLMTKNDIWIGVSGKIFVFERGLLKETDDYELKIRVPPRKTSPEVGKLTAFTFVKETSQILVATTRGAVLVYGYTIEYQKGVEATNIENLRFIKVLKVEQSRINVIVNVDGVIVTGNSEGDIHFYDPQMKLVYWVHGFHVDSVKGLSFNISPRSYTLLNPKCKSVCVCWEKMVSEIDPITGVVRQKLMKTKIPTDATVGGKPFIVRDFVVCTQKQGVGFVDFATEKLSTILDNNISHALAITMHPDKPFLCIGFSEGVIEMHNFVQHKLFKRIDLRDHYKIVIPPKDDSIKCNTEITKPLLSVTCLKYSPSGLHLACGLNTGELIFLDPTTIDILNEKPFKDTQYGIKEINYSCDSLSLVLVDLGRTVAVYKYDCEKYEWYFVGKHRAHYKDINTAFFLPKLNDDGEYKVISLGVDRVMAEYDIGKSSEEYLEIFSLDRVDQTAVPLSAIPWPTPSDLDPEEHRTDLPLILIANSEHKYKIVNYSTTMTLSTVLGPRYEHPVNKIQLITVTKDEKQFQYLLFSTKNVIGIQKMPLDGNPWKHVGMLGHPIEVINMCFREDMGILFTIGARDNCMIQWAANYRAVETTTKLSGEDLDPYYCLIEDGRPGWLFQEIRDLFYYIQILCQGTFSPAMRRVKDYIPIDSLPDLMRALGFFPTEYEVENLIVEAKFKVYQQRPSTEIDFEEFVKLYLNHRPAFGDSFKNLRNSFALFSAVERDSSVIRREDFIDMLTCNGEYFTRELAWYLLSILYGHSFEDRATMTENDFSFLPEEITFAELVNNMIGIQDIENLSEYSGLSGVSQSVATDSDEPIE